MTGRRHKARRQRNQLVKRRPDRVLEVSEHKSIPTPFLIFTWTGGGAVRAVIVDGKLELHTFGGVNGCRSREISPEEWPDPVCVWMAEKALTEGATR